MPFSTKLEQEYRELVQENFNKVTFSDEKDFDSFCPLVDKLITLSDVKPASPDEIKSGKFDEDIQNLLELIDGFDLYATDRIIDLTTHTQTGRGTFSPWVHVPAFTSDQEDKALKITEARIEFKKIIIDEIQNRNNELKLMSSDKKNQYIIELAKRRDIAHENHRIIVEHKAGAIRDDNTEAIRVLNQTLLNFERAVLAQRQDAAQIPNQNNWSRHAFFPQYRQPLTEPEEEHYRLRRAI